MLIWLDGALDPQEIRDRVFRDGDVEFGSRLCSYVDDIIRSDSARIRGRDLARCPNPCDHRFTSRKPGESDAQ